MNLSEKLIAQIRVGRGQAGVAIAETLVRDFVEMVGPVASVVLSRT